MWTRPSSLVYNAHMQTIRTSVKDILASHRLEATPARESILRICIASDKPLDVNYVAEKMGDKAHLATVYRTLEKFVASGILERVDFQEGKFRYEYMHDHHHHAICNSCGKVEDVEDRGIEVIESNIKSKTGFTVTRHALELFGLCNTCHKKGIYA
jgi:Fe2+ or Zn2+ uptake regulation protein